MLDVDHWLTALEYADYMLRPVTLSYCPYSPTSDNGPKVLELRQRSSDLWEHPHWPYKRPSLQNQQQISAASAMLESLPSLHRFHSHRHANAVHCLEHHSLGLRSVLRLSVQHSSRSQVHRLYVAVIHLGLAMLTCQQLV